MRTNFGAGLDHATPMSCYDPTHAGKIRRAIASGNFAYYEDARKTVDAMIVAIDSPNPPLRLALGQSAYHSMREALLGRLKILEAQKGHRAVGAVLERSDCSICPAAPNITSRTGRRRMDNFGTDTRFAGSIPDHYDSLLVPLIFAPCAADRANRVAARPSISELHAPRYYG